MLRALADFELFHLFYRPENPQHTRNLNFVAVKRLQLNLDTLYRNWVDNAPRDYQAFFRSRRLAVITCRYGQNAPIELFGDLENQANEFARMHRWHDARWVSIALATHIT